MAELTLDDGEAGLARIEAALARDPANRKLNEARHYMLLSLGRLAEGWREYHWHLSEDLQVSYDTFPVARWDGGGLAGKHVLVWTEHGVGDQVFAAGMLPDLLAAAGSVTVMCNRRLAPWFRRSFPGAHIYRVGEAVPARLAGWDFDCQLSVADLGAAFRPSLKFMTRPYLRADAVRAFKLRARYRQEGKRLVGLAWRSKNHVNGLGKSMSLGELEPVLRRPGLRFVSLQYGDCGGEIAEAKARFGVEIVADPEINQLTDMDGFAAQAAAMDFVVTTSNTAAHVAGALGVPGVVMLPRGDRGRFWYWHNERADSPWYPSLRLIRQERPGDWAGVAAQVGAMLGGDGSWPGLALTA